MNDKLGKLIITGSRTHVADFVEKLGRQRTHVVMQALTDAIKVVEKSGKPGSEKKRIAKRLAKDLIDIPEIPDWAEDLAIDYFIDVLVLALFPAPAGVNLRGPA